MEGRKGVNNKSVDVFTRSSETVSFYHKDSNVWQLTDYIMQLDDLQAVTEGTMSLPLCWVDFAPFFCSFKNFQLAAPSWFL